MFRNKRECKTHSTFKRCGKSVQYSKQTSKRHSINWLIVGFTAFMLTGIPSAAAKKFGELSCYRHVCWRVPSRALLAARVGEHFVAKASWYDVAARDRYNRPGLTSSGEKFDSERLDRISSPNLPNGTKVLLWSPVSKVAAYAIVNNTGPFMGNRVIDIPIGLARAMGFVKQGVAQLRVVIVKPPSLEDARYRANRRYDFQGGLLGSFETMHDAVDALSTPIIAKGLERSNPKPLSFGRIALLAKGQHARTRRKPRAKAKRGSRFNDARWQRAVFEE